MFEPEINKSFCKYCKKELKRDVKYDFHLSCQNEFDLDLKINLFMKSYSCTYKKYDPIKKSLKILFSNIFEQFLVEDF